MILLQKFMFVVLHELFQNQESLLSEKWTANEFVQNYNLLKSVDMNLRHTGPTLMRNHISSLRNRRQLPERHKNVYNWKPCIKYWIEKRISEML